MTVEPTKIQTPSALQNDCLNFSFLKDIHVVGEKIARKHRKTAIYQSQILRITLQQLRSNCLIYILCLRLTWPILIPMRYFNFTCSEYLIIFLSMERYIFLCHAHFKHHITYRKTQIYVGCIVVATFFYNLPIWFERTWTMDENGKVIMQNTILRKIHIYTEVYETWMYTVFNLMLPLVCLITLNFLILKKVLST